MVINAHTRARDPARDRRGQRRWDRGGEIAMRWTADKRTGRLLGCQLVGHRDAQVAARIDVPAAALHAGWTIDRINDLDLSYTPPFGSPWDALQVGAQVWQNVANAVRPGRAIARGGLRRRRP
jgi:hypothetical protein